MSPGPPPEITEKPASDKQARDVLGDLRSTDGPGLMRALPNIDTAGRMPRRRSVAATNSAIIPNTRHASCPLVVYVACGSISSGILVV